MRGLPFVIILGGLSASLAVCGGLPDGGRALQDRVGESIARIVVDDSFRFSVRDPDSYRTEIDSFYRSREFEPAWIEVDGSNEQLRDIVHVLCMAESEGLNRRAYVNELLRERIDGAYASPPADDSLRAQNLALLDVTVTSMLMNYTSDLLAGRVDPRELGRTWNTPVNEIDVLDVVKDTMSAQWLGDIAQLHSSRHLQYGYLRDALRRYHDVAATGGWPQVADGESISVRDTGSRVSKVIERLAATGDVDSSLIPIHADSARYTQNVAGGVEQFQHRHGLEPDGIVGENVIREMNVPVDERIRQIELNLERWRWIPPHLGSRYLYVNVPAFELHAFEDGKEAMSMAVVVGEEYENRATPVFSDTMEYVVFNPYWNIPQSIASSEIIPEAREDEDYLDRNDYEILTGWDEGADVVSPDSVAFELVEDGQYRIRQKPGTQNALGQIKFMFPNQFDIYLHDTPAEHLFDQARRAYSHGCIRVERPVELAEFVFASDEWTPARIRSRFETYERSTEYVDAPLPVYILYWTAFVDRDGRVNFRQDIYGHDAVLRDALQAQAASALDVPCDSLIANLGG